MHLLFGVAAVDGDVDDSEIQIIQQIASYLGISATQLSRLRNKLNKQ